MREFINIYTIGFVERFVNRRLEARPCFLVELRLRTRRSVGREGASGIVSVRAGILNAFPVRIRWGESAYPARQS